MKKIIESVEFMPGSLDCWIMDICVKHKNNDHMFGHLSVLRRARAGGGSSYFFVKLVCEIAAV